MKKIFGVLALSLLFVGSANAQDEEKLIVKPSGRILLDGGLFKAKEGDEKFNDGFAVPDMRVGFKAK